MAADEGASAAETESEDRSLMARVQSGDETALGTLMARWERPVKAVVARLVLNAAEAEELRSEEHTSELQSH